MPFYGDFDFDLAGALAEQLIAAFEDLDLGLLTTENLGEVPEEQGLYQLHFTGTLVYVGKADKSLRSRLADHLWKISGRRNIDVAQVQFRCLTVPNTWTPYAPESMLISAYTDQGLCSWNGNGFGPHDPGRNREETNKAPEGFDALYPIREEWVCEGITAGDWNGRELLQALKAQLPYLLRYETTDPRRYRQGHPDYNDATITVPSTGMTAVELLRTIAQQLQPGWQATRFPSHMILYKENRTYQYGTVIWPEPAQG